MTASSILFSAYVSKVLLIIPFDLVAPAELKVTSDESDSASKYTWKRPTTTTLTIQQKNKQNQKQKQQTNNKEGSKKMQLLCINSHLANPLIIVVHVQVKLRKSPSDRCARKFYDWNHRC